MAAKKDKMIPSEKERKRALKYATLNRLDFLRLYECCKAQI